MEIDSASPGAAASGASAMVASSASPHATTLASSASGDEPAPVVIVTHSCTVRAIHRLWCPALTEQQNQARWGAPGMAVHGHTYEFQVKSKGPVSRKTGKIADGAIIEDALHMGIHEVLNRKNLDTDVSFFINRPSTLENICLFAWRNVGVIMAHTGTQVYEVSVEADPCPRADGTGIERTRVSFSGEMGTLTV